MSSFHSFSNDCVPVIKPSQGYLLSRNLCSLFINYINANRVRAPDAKLLTELVGTFQDGAKHDRRALQSKFKNWARRMDVSADGKLVIQQSGKEILPFESCEEVVMEMHLRGCNEHRSIDVIVEEIRSMYTWGRRDFGMDWDIVTSILSKCNDKECLQRLQMRFQPKLLPFKRPRRSSSLGRDASDVPKKNISEDSKIMVPLNADRTLSDKSTTVKKPMPSTSEPHWIYQSKLKEGSPGKMSANASKQTSSTNSQKKKKSLKQTSKSERKVAEHKVTFRIEINSSGYDLKSASAFKGDLKNFITSYFKQEAKSHEVNKESHTQEIGKVILKTNPLSSTLQLCSASVATSLKPILPALPFLLPLGTNVPLNFQSLMPSNSQKFCDTKESSYSAQKKLNEKSPSIVTYTLPSRPLSSAPSISLLKPNKNVGSTSLDTCNTSSDTSFITTIVTHIPSKKLAVNCQNTAVSFCSSDSNESDKDSLTSNALKSKPMKLKLVIEKIKSKNFVQKETDNINISLQDEQATTANNKNEQANKSSLYQESCLKLEDQAVKDKDIEGMYNILVSMITGMRGSIFPALVGTGRGKNAENLRSRIDQCMKQVREIKSKLVK